MKLEKMKEVTVNFDFIKNSVSEFIKKKYIIHLIYLYEKN